MSKGIATLKSQYMIPGQGSLKVIEGGTIRYYCSLVTLSLRCTVFEIFDFKNVVSLKTGLGFSRGH